MRYGNDLILPTHSRLVFKRNQAAISILKEVFVMNETDYNARLYEKMKAEQDNYRDWLVRQAPPEIPQPHLRVHDAGGHRNVYGGAGA